MAVVTIEEIARRAGVSAGTVSRILNGKNKEGRPATARRCQRVRDIARQLGYRPNTAARSILRGRFDLAAFVTCGDVGLDWFPHPLLHGCQSRLEKSSMRLVVNEIPAQGFDDPNFVPRLLAESAVDGVVINLNPGFGERIVTYFEADRVPCVWFNRDAPLRCVYPDDHGGGAMLTRGLIAKGHRRVGYLPRSASPGRPDDEHFSRRRRHEGFADAMTDAGFDPRRSLDAAEGGADFLGRAGLFLERFPDATAAVTYELQEAVALWVAAERRGRRVPDDLAITTFHECPARFACALRLPTAIIPFQKIGEGLAGMLHAIIETGDREAESIRVPFERVEE